MKKGFTLVEVIIAIILSAIALFGIETLIVASFQDWKTGRDIVDLQRDLDVASYKIKGVLEEAGADSATILDPGPNSGIRIRVGNSRWLKEKEFYRKVEGNEQNLIYEDDGNEEKIINTLHSITFKNSLPDKCSVRVDLTVGKGTTRTKDWLDSSFLVYLRNKGGG